jgi:hypothetical protein
MARTQRPPRPLQRISPAGNRRSVLLFIALAACGLLAGGLAQLIGSNPAAPPPGDAASASYQAVVGLPRQLPAAVSATCSSTVSNASALQRAVADAAADTVVCLSPGRYSGLALEGRRATDVTVQAVPGQRVTIEPGVQDSHEERVAIYIKPDTSHVIVHGFYIHGEVELGQGSSFVRFDHNDITGGVFGIRLDSNDCKTANAPTWSDCGPQPKITNVTISANRIHDLGGATGQDSINVNNFANLRITGNDLYGMLEGGNHTDCFQSTFGGSGLVFDHNYEHDNNCQGFFIKDGDVTDALLYDNLFVRDQVANQPEANLDIVNVYRLTLENNTSWPGTDDILRDFSSAQPPRATIERNVIETFANGCCTDPVQFAMTEGQNIFGNDPWTFRPSATDSVSKPQFLDANSDDYRLAHNPGDVGVDWSPTTQRYGP